MHQVADRRRFVACLAGLPIGAALLEGELWAQAAAQQPPRVTKAMLLQAAAVSGQSFTDAELDAMVARVNDNLAVVDNMEITQEEVDAIEKDAVDSGINLWAQSSAE